MIAITPKPLPGGYTVGQLAGNQLVRFDYVGTERATWKEGPLFHKTAFSATREVETSDAVYAMPHYTPDYQYRFRNGMTSNIPSPQRFIPAGASFESALSAASKMNGASVNGQQAVAVVQADQGQYFLAPLGYYTNSGAFKYGSWTAPDTLEGTVQRGGEWKLELDSDAAVVPANVPGKAADYVFTGGRLTSITPLHQAVKALVDRNGWYDLRSGAAVVDAAAGSATAA
ncbi:MAG: hypothetical protein JWL76_1297 [Thermoleophilia bacterium]|nr:hypothetical protein [Thermoleophilia bacterium]